MAAMALSGCAASAQDPRAAPDGVSQVAEIRVGTERVRVDFPDQEAPTLELPGGNS